MERNGGSKRTRSDRGASGGAIEQAALKLFLRKGFRDTTTDEIAEMAGVSKRAIYRNFADKENLFEALIRRSIERAQSFLQEMGPTLENADDLRTALRQVALSYVGAVFQPQVLQLRRLVLSEARHFPELASFYYREVPEATLTDLAKFFERLAEQGRLRVPDSAVAARQFAAMLIMLPLDKAMFGGSVSRPELERAALAGVDTFLAAYGPHED